MWDGIYHSRDVEDFASLNLALASAVGPTARVIVSEPIGRFSEIGSAVPQSSSVSVHGGDLEIRPFAPVA